MPLDVKVEFLAVDEVQLAADRERGHVFTDRILSARGSARDLADRRRDDPAAPAQAAPRRRLPDAAAALDAVLRRAEDASRSCRRARRVIVFSLRELYEVAARLRRERGGAALVFGALSPRTRNAQVGLYQARRRRPPGRHRRDRHGAEPRHRHRRLHGPHQVRRASARVR